NLEDRRVLATLIVNSSADNQTIGDDQLTLREAIASVAQGQLVDGSASSQVTGDFGSDDTIQFSPIFDGQIFTLTTAGSASAGNSAFGISNALVIDGETGLNAGITIAAADGSNFRLFYVSSTGELTLKGLTLSGGTAQGGNGGSGSGAGGGGGAGLGGAIFNA